MSPLVKIRAERDRMSAVERRIADSVLETLRPLCTEAVPLREGHDDRHTQWLANLERIPGMSEP